MNDNILLAIIIPAYKTTFLREAFESIAKQTDKRFNVYVGDDCSPENIAEIVEEYKYRLPITYFRFDSNLGSRDLVGQWERCIALSTDEPYIWLFSDDDLMDNNCVESFYNHVDDLKEDSLIHFNIRRINSYNSGKTITELSKYPPFMTAEDFLIAKSKGKVVSYVVEFIFSRVLYENTGGFVKFDLAWGSDYMTWLKFAIHSSKGIVTIDDAKVNWRSSDYNISPNKSHSILLRKLNALIENAVYIKYLMNRYPESFIRTRNKFRYLRFPLGEIYKNQKNIRIIDCIKLVSRYISHIWIKNRKYFYN